jgi:hypothetical protein
MEEILNIEFKQYQSALERLQTDKGNSRLQFEVKRLKTSIDTICRINELPNPIKPEKSIEDEIADILPGPVKVKVEPDKIKYFTSDFGNLTWNQTQKIITFDNGVVFTEKELLTLHQCNEGKMITTEQWNLKESFKGKFVEPVIRMFDAKTA